MEHSEVKAGCFGHFFTRKTRSRAPSSQPSRQDEPAKREPHVHRDSMDLKMETKTPDHIKYFNPCCQFSYGAEDEWWVEGKQPPSYSPKAPNLSTTGDVCSVIERTLDKESAALRALSLKIHGSPEIMFEEKYAHDVLTEFMVKRGFNVTRHYLGLSTAWRAEYTQGTGGRVIGINSEMDALPGMGHACGHNLIAISGVGVAIALKAALQAQPHISAKIVLLGTPAEEGGGGKILLLERGGYEQMDACIMCHPAVGPAHSTALGSSNAMQSITVEYFGHSAHAAGAPWEGTNALDAAFMAYSGISVLRQQIKPDHRVHGVVEGKNWVPNVIPDYAKMFWIARAPTSADLIPFVKRVRNCLEAAALATGCKINLTLNDAYFDLHQNSVLAQDFADIVGTRYGLLARTTSTSASTDFGNISYALPSLHPAFAIPTEPNGGNHTPAFAKAASSEAAHAATIVITKGLAMTGYRILTDAEFFNRVQASFKRGKC